MTVIIIAMIVGAVLGTAMAVNGSRKRRDRRDANRYLAEQYRAGRKR